MQLGLTLGYRGRAMPDGLVELATAAKRAGFDAAWTGESWGSGAFSHTSPGVPHSMQPASMSESSVASSGMPWSEQATVETEANGQERHRWLAWLGSKT